jgi:phosphomannomutase
MTLISSISGIRGTIGGSPGNNLTPVDIVRFASAYATYIKKANPGKRKCRVVTGRDGRMSGEMISMLAATVLNSMGIDVYDIGLTTTPTVEVAVPMLNAQGGIIFTASHNPEEWNALKLLNEKGEFLSKKEGENILAVASAGKFKYSTSRSIGKIIDFPVMNTKHLKQVTDLKLVDKKAIKSRKFKVVVDGINSSGGIMVPRLLQMLGLQAEDIFVLNWKPDGRFAHNPEPLPGHLGEIVSAVKEKKADLGIVVDPDVDRLAFVCEDGSFFGEEYTLVAVADYVLSKTPGNTVSNLSSTRALKDVTEKYGKKYTASAVGEVNVVEAMKKTKAVIGGEGNGGIIYPAAHYGRDALVGVALFLSHLAQQKCKMTQLRKKYPDYFVSKNKVALSPKLNFEAIQKKLMQDFKGNEFNLSDGIRIDFKEGWVHLRKSNTEPIVRIYAEARNQKQADELAKKVVKYLK